MNNNNPLNNNNNNSNSNNNSQAHMNKVLAHSTTLLTNADSYMAGMSSDSEISTGGRHHHSRPYSSQSRVYHAHPAPRNLHLSSSRMSHYSDSAANYMAGSTSSAASQTSVQKQLHQQQHQHQQQQQQQILHHQQQQHQKPLANINQQLTHQGSVSSSGSGSSGSNIYFEHAAAMQAAAAAAAARPPPQTNRQLSQATLGRPFKQSMSIDQHALAASHYQASSPLTSGLSLAHQPIELPGGVGVGEHLYSPQQQQQQQQQSSQSHQSSQQSYTSQQQQQRYQPSINSRQQLEMELLERQTANINLYEKQQQQHHRQLPTANISSMSVDHLNYQQQQQQHHHHHHQLQKQIEQQYHPIEHHKHQQQELYSSHQVTSSPADWLPSIGPQGSQHHHQLNAAFSSGRPSQLKQTMSIDHYQINQSPALHYATSGGGGGGGPSRSGSAGLSHQFTDPSFRATPLNYASYDSPPTSQLHLHHHHQQHPHQQNYQQQDLSNQYHEQVAPPTSQLQEFQQMQPLAHHHPMAGYNTTSSSIQKSHLQHQVSSSSSNSQSGSLRSSNVDISKAMVSATDSTHKSHLPSSNYIKSTQSTLQQSTHIKRNYHQASSKLTGLSSSNSALEEQPIDSMNQLHQQTGHSSANYGPRSHKSALRAASPSLGLEISQYNEHQHNLSRDTGAVAGSSGVGGAGSRSESSTGLPNGSNSNSAGSLTKKSNSATQLSMTGTKKRLGFRKKQVTSFSVHRSEEVAPLEARHLVKQGSSVSEGDSSMSGDSSSRSWSNSNFKQPTPDELASMSFIDGLGKGQMISRQGLASPYLGDIQLSLCDRRGNLEIEVIRARNLQAKTSKVLPRK